MWTWGATWLEHGASTCFLSTSSTFLVADQELPRQSTALPVWLPTGLREVPSFAVREHLQPGPAGVPVEIVERHFGSLLDSYRRTSWPKGSWRRGRDRGVLAT